MTSPPVTRPHRTLPLTVHQAAQMTLPTSVQGEVHGLLPLCMDLYAPTAVHACMPYECTLACIRPVHGHMESAADDCKESESAPSFSIITTVTTQPPAYLDHTSLAP